ncbi:MAG: Rhamnulokinase [Planctomycetes bacterium ADurb.Bin126]|nr:MAG: Rhamnulokinase [Planctomycetes bacterium ADurb.Bin126]HOD81456.1 rhamnulokinase family protein [Phycisphaerae bacterium]HQL75390.1 rhamnulokinase family protein [Phycisphaerae bacterium]
MAEHRFLALDLGAESGRAEVVTLADGRVRMAEIHRWPNRPVRLGGTLYWDFPFLFAEVLASLKAAAQRKLELRSASVCTWGVDFGLLGRNGQLLGNPVHYRDSRTADIHAYANGVLPSDAVFEATGGEPWAISSLYQLLAMQRDGNDLLEAAHTFLQMPDLFQYFLTGQARNELSNVNTGNLLGVDGRWAEGVIEAFKLPRRMFGELARPGTVLGPLSQGVREQCEQGELPVIATCGHDTGAAVAAIPGQGDNWAFLSCGTWSILGCELERPVTDLACLRAGFTNEITLGSWYVCRNILGLWLVQELRRKWNRPGDEWGYDRMTAEATGAGSGPLINARDASLMAPADMEAAQIDLLRRTGQGEPAGRGQLVRCVLESLALEYNHCLDTLGRLTGRRPATVYMVGGGTANKLLCQFTADACGVEVHAGVDQCTALGNALVQALALGVLKDKAELRRVVRESFEMHTYRPQNQDEWAAKRERYAAIQQQG